MRRQMMQRAVADSFRKLNPRWMVRNPVMFVVEVGSFLSHAGTIAREYGMPCVVDVADCTRRIKSGDRIRVDGSRGEVALLELADA